MSKKIIFFDIDGTLITENEARFMPESARRSIKQARENGNLVFINTGRVFVNIEENIRDVGFDGYVCGCGTYINYNNEVLMYNKLNKEYCREIADKLREYKVQALFERKDKIFLDYTMDINKDILKLKTYFEKRDKSISGDVIEEDFSFDKFTAWYGEESNFQEFYNFISKDFEYIDRGNGFCEIVPKGFSKATAMEFLLKYFNLPLESCYALGDSLNDLPMLIYAPNSIAMGGSEQLYDKVSYVTKSVLDDGIWHALKHFSII